MSSTYEEEYGKLNLPPHSSNAAVSQRASSPPLPDIESGAALTMDLDDPSLPPSRAFAEMYRQPIQRSVFTAEKFMRWSRRDGRTEEANLWSLLLELLLDAEQSSKHDPDAIGLTQVQPHRRWYVSQHAHLQDLLQRHPQLRRMNVVLRWLEQTYRDQTSQLRLEASRSHGEAVLLRQIVLSHLRGGELHRAVDVAVSARDCTYSCVLSAAQLRSVPEPWHHLSPPVPLFGEYGSSEVDRTWADNTHRLDNLSQLYDDAEALAASAEGSTAIGGLDAVIAAVLCGHLRVMEPAFAPAGDWRDALWCHLRAGLVLCFTKALMAAGVPVSAPYAALVETLTGAQDRWQEATARRVVCRAAALLRTAHLPTAALHEALQMRLLLQFLAAEEAADWFADAAAPPPGSEEAARVWAHLLLCLDAAHAEVLQPYAVQPHLVRLVDALSLHAEALARLPRSRPEEVVGAVSAMALRLREGPARASVYAAFLLSSRRRGLARGADARREVWREEERLVRAVCRADPDDAVHAEVMRHLERRTAPTARLTHSAAAEAVLWRAMHADSDADVADALGAALGACGALWRAEPRAELDAIDDVAGILRRRLLPALAPAESGGRAAAEAHFWVAFSAARATATSHARRAAELDVAAGRGERRLVFQLEQSEAAQRRALRSHVEAALDHGGALVRRDRTCVTAVVWVAQLFAENAALAARLASQRGGADPMEPLRDVFAVVERMEALGYLDPKLIPRQSARELFDTVCAVRMACGERAHDLLVQDAKRAAAAKVRLDGFGTTASA